jgi:YfiR/HmsC-like
VAILTRIRIRACVAALLTIWAWGLAPAHAEQRTPTAEDDIKAAFLYNFTKFVEWPVAGRPETFTICTVAEPAFDAAVDRIVAGESVDGHPIVRISPGTPDAARACQILFIARPENDRAERWIAAVRNAPVLVVGESRGPWDRGAQINFVVDDNRVKFDVNPEAAARAGLTISSKLLRVARTVTPRGTI